MGPCDGARMLGTVMAAAVAVLTEVNMSALLHAVAADCRVGPMLGGEHPDKPQKLRVGPGA